MHVPGSLELLKFDPPCIAPFILRVCGCVVSCAGFEMTLCLLI